MSRRPIRPRRAPKQRAPASADPALARPTRLQQGVQHLERREWHAARQCFEQAQQADPSDAVAVNCLGIVARMERRIPDAIACFERAVQLRPDFAEAHNNLGNALRDAGRPGDAERCYQQALLLKPDFADAHNNLGVVHLSRGDLTAATRCFDEAVRLLPTHAEAHNNLANVMRQRGELLDAMASFRTALELKPDSAQIHNNLANVLRELGQLDDARKCYEQAINLDPSLAEAFGNLGDVLNDLEQSDSAIAAHLRAVELQPAHPVESLVRLGTTYQLVGKVQPAREAYIRALSLDRQHLGHAVRISALCPPVFRSRQEMDRRSEQALHEWSRLAEQSRAQGGWQLTGSITEPSFHWQFLHDNLRPLKETYARIFGPSFLDRFTCSKPKQRSGRPRIGIVVTYGHEGLFLRSLAGIVERINTQDMEFVIVCSRASEPRLRRGIARELPFAIIPSDLAKAAATIQEACFDVLYYWEIGTDATNYFLPFLRLAPVQCTSWGIQVTSGIGNVDYYLASELVEPADAVEHYSERLLYASTLLTYQRRPRASGASKSRDYFGIGHGRHAYVCAQQVGKFHPDFDPLLAEILRRDHLGIVVIAPGDRYGNATRMLRERLAITIPDVADRFIFLPRLDYEEYLELLRVADVLLDPPHFSGVNSTYDALALGQPVVTWPSPCHRGRYTAGCYRKMGVSAGRVASAADYVQLAVTLATEDDLRHDMREQIREASNSLFGDRLAVHEHERLFAELAQKAAEGAT